MTALVPVDAEALVVAYLSAVMPAVIVGTRVDRRAGMVKVEQTSGVRAGHATDLPVVAVQCWEDSTVAASSRSREALAHLWAMRDHPTYGYLVREVSDVGLPAHFPDPTSEAERYQFAVQLNLRPTESGDLP